MDDGWPHWACYSDVQLGFYLRLSSAMSNDRRRALTTVDAATRDDADEKMLGH